MKSRRAVQPHAGEGGFGKRKTSHAILIALAVCATFWLLVRLADHFSAPMVVSVETDPAPSLTEFVNDEMHVLTPAEKMALEEKLSGFSRETSIQAVVAILSLPSDVALEEFTIQTAQASRIGQSGADNGLILFVFPHQGIARLEIGYGMEGVIPDLLASRLLTEHLKPAWKGALYGEALESSIDAIISLSRAEYAATKEPGRFARLVRTFQVGSVKLAKRAWPAVRQVSLWHQIVSSFFAALILVGLFDGIRQAIALTRNIALSIRNARSGQSMGTDTVRVDLKAITDSAFPLVLFFGAIIAAAGAVLIAGGGAFGGGGATVHF
ncbi:MAG: TPM domain-containing protein [Dokdonella sp.]